MLILKLILGALAAVAFLLFVGWTCIRDRKGKKGKGKDSV